MKTLASRFLSFEETLGAGLVKFAYFVLLFVLVVLTVIAMIAGIVSMVDGSFGAGLAQFLLAPLQLVLALILLRVGTEVVLAILSIDDHLTDGARHAAALPGTAAAGAAYVADGGSASTSAAASSTATKKATSTKKAAKKTARKSAAKKAASKSAPSAKKTAAAAKAATRPSETSGDKADDAQKPGGEAAGAADEPKTD